MATESIALLNAVEELATEAGTLKSYADYACTDLVALGETLRFISETLRFISERTAVLADAVNKTVAALADV